MFWLGSCCLSFVRVSAQPSSALPANSLKSVYRCEVPPRQELSSSRNPGGETQCERIAVAMVLRALVSPCGTKTVGNDDNFRHFVNEDDCG